MKKISILLQIIKSQLITERRDKMGYNDKEMKNFEIRIVVSAPDIETAEDWFCGTVMGEVGICEIQSWGVDDI
jgi:hypothetical protein